MRHLKQLAFFVFCATWCAVAVHAQAVGASGEIGGVVTDPRGAAVANAAVQAVDLAKNFSRTVYSDRTGQYLLSGLAPSTYSVTVKMAGFRTTVQREVVVTVGQKLALDFHLQISRVEELVEITSEPPLVETARASQSNTIERKQIENLPIDRRDYLEYTLLMPGVTDSRRVSGDADYRVAQTPQSGLSFYGSNGRGNNVTVDGGEANDDSGSVRPNLGQESVQEYQINRSNYSAEFGAASGAAINIVSKSGTNKLRGSLFGLFRNDAADARSRFATTPALAPGQTFNPASPDLFSTPSKNSLNRQQFGAFIGFPISKDKNFMFLSYEGIRNNAQNSVPILESTKIFRVTTDQQPIINALAAQGAANVPCLSSPPTVLPANVCAAVLTNVLTVNPATSVLNRYIVNIFEDNAGLQPFDDAADYAMVRFDHLFSSRNQLFVRYNFGRDDQSNPTVQALTAFSRGSKTNQRNHTLQANWFHQFNDSISNELRLQWGYANLDVIPNSQGGVGLNIPGYGNFGRDIFLPDHTIMSRPDFADNVSWMRGHHNMKLGGDLLLRNDRSESHTFMSGRFVFGSLPGALITPCFLPSPSPGTPNPCGVTTTGASIDALQSVAISAPQFYQQGFGNPKVASWNPYPSVYWEDSWRALPNFTLNFGARYEVDKRYEPLVSDYNNVAPRISFAWDPANDHKTVVRAGYGIFYSPTYYQIDYVVRALGLLNGNRQIANYFVPLTGVPGFPPTMNSKTIFQTLFAQGKVQCSVAAAGSEACITPADLTQFGINVTNTGPVPPLAVLFSGASNYQNPMAQQAELSIEREVAPGLSMSASFIHVHTTHMPRAVDTNLLAGAPIVNVTEGGATYPLRKWNAPPCTSIPTACFANPLLLQNNVYTSSAAALYNGGIFEVRKRFSDHYMIVGNYTYSHATDDATDYNSDYEAFDQINLAGERAVSDFDQRHKLVIMGVFESPWNGGDGASAAEKIFSGFTFSPTFRYNSGRPFNLLAGTDVNGDRHSTNDRPVGVGRNTGLGPDYASFDMRLARQFKLNERTAVQFTFEAFNLFNRTNWASVNNTVGPDFLATSPSAHVKGSSIGASTPLGFTSAYPQRELQLGVRLTF